MLELEDFFHLSQLDRLVEQIVDDGPGLIVVAGLDPRPPARPAGGDTFPPSGRSTLFRILVRRLLAAHQPAQATVVAETEEAVRVPRNLRRQVRFSLVEPPESYADCIAAAIRRQPTLLVVDRLDEESAAAALEASRQGRRVLAQYDTVFRGADVARSLLDLGVPPDLLAGLSWVVAVQRLATLCPQCKRPAPPDPAQLAQLRLRYPDLPHSALRHYPELDLEQLGQAFAGQASVFLRAAGCPHCHGTGRYGDVAAFDIFRLDPTAPDPLAAPSLLPLEEYMLCLAALGYLPLDDVLQLAQDQLRRTYSLLTASERALRQANTALARNLVELQAANQVLQQRTEALVSLQDVGQALITSTDLADLARRVCLHTHDLCGADRAILYLLRSADSAELLAASGWDLARVPPRLDAAQLRTACSGAGSEPTPFDHWPPGISPRHPDLEGAILRAGLYVPLEAQGKRVGVMLVHTTEKAHFTPGEVSLLQTFAQQAALAIQRAGLIEELRENIAQLQAAQAELVQKERMERELELARQVQQSVLPRTFPQVPGYTFAAGNEPAHQVGGDFYDAFWLDEHRFGLVIADVSDKGMPAALYMALSRSLLLAEARRERSPRVVLSNVHRLLAELGQPEMFVTMFYGVVDGPARRLTYARAGHDLPLLFHGGTVQRLGGAGTFLGYPEMDELQLSEEQVDLAPGDRLVLYTDGLIDALAPDGRPFGLERFIASLQGHAGLTPAGLCPAVLADLFAYQGTAGQYDDMALLIVDVI